MRPRNPPAKDDQDPQADQNYELLRGVEEQCEHEGAEKLND